MKLFLLPFLMSLYTLLNASAVIGFVEKVDGSVKVKHEGSFKKTKVKNGLDLRNGDLVTTSKDSNAVLKLVDGSVLALAESSAIHFTEGSNAQQTEGKVYYKITTRDAKNSLKIKTPFAIIGIKGTTFVINAGEDSSLKLQEGLVGVSSLKEEFKLYRKEVLQEFNNYVDGENAEFEKFKNPDKKPEPVVTKEFDLEAMHTISFSDNEVRERVLSKDDEKEFNYFEKLIKPAN
ncbi:FecR domain-containing protein [Sulfurimonas sp.]|nr:FecR domain-containing protein [Sulfurimonas sp.]